jgi:LmbE family N-acetylglucosaminyl deacetylase
LAIIAPHPDDETFGTGGLIAQQISIGCQVKVVFLTSGEAAHQTCCSLSANEITRRRENISKDALSILGCDSRSVEYLRYPDGNLPNCNSKEFIGVSRRIAEIIEDWKPTCIFCPHPFEGWSDHIAAEELTRAAINKLSYQPQLYHYCVWFWYSMPLKRVWHVDWQRARVLDIARQLPLKQHAFRLYLNSLAECGHPWVGTLPAQFLHAFQWDRELFFEVDSAFSSREHQ